jgi:hypothetical protein
MGDFRLISEFSINGVMKSYNDGTHGERTNMGIAITPAYEGERFIIGPHFGVSTTIHQGDKKASGTDNTFKDLSWSAGLSTTIVFFRRRNDLAGFNLVTAYRWDHYTVTGSKLTENGIMLKPSLLYAAAPFRKVGFFAELGAYTVYIPETARFDLGMGLSFGLFFTTHK